MEYYEYRRQQTSVLVEAPIELESQVVDKLSYHEPSVSLRAGAPWSIKFFDNIVDLNPRAF